MPAPTIISPLSKPTPVVEYPHTLFIDHASIPITFDWPSFKPATGAFIDIPLDGAGAKILDVRNYRKVSVLIGPTKAAKGIITIGKISGSTLSVQYDIPIDGKVHSFDVVGPEINLGLTGSTSSPKESVQAWIYFTS